MYIILIILVHNVLCDGNYYDTFTGLKISKERFDNLQRVGLTPVCAQEIPPCSASEPRRVDGSCNNLAHPQRGASFTPFRRLLEPNFAPGGGLRISQTGAPLPPVRPLRVDLVSDGRIYSRRHTLLVAMYFLIIAADVTSVHDTVNYVSVTTNCCQPEGREDPRCIPIEVFPDDLHLRASNVRCLNLTRSATYQRLGCVPDDIPPERVNQATPMLDLSIVYGNDARAAANQRQYSGGRLQTDLIQGKEWPKSGGSVCVNNRPPLETRCHSEPAGANSLLGINLTFLWLFRHHNYIARMLQHLNPCWSDDKLYYTARDINTAMAIQIAYYELMPEFLGYDFLVDNGIITPTGGHVEDYDPELEPRVSIEFVTALRWFHTVQEGRHKLYTSDGRVYDEVATVDFILRTGALVHNNTVAGLTRGAHRQPGADVDDVVDPDLGERVLGRLQFVSDVVSSDIMKGRDLGLGTYSDYRKLCGLDTAKSFDDLRKWMDDEKVDILARYYAIPADIDLMTGIMSERRGGGGGGGAGAGAGAGGTLACVLAEQLRRWRRADRHWYERPARHSRAQLSEIRKMTLAKLLCLHGDGVSAVQPKAFLLPGHGNEIMDCSKYEMPDLSAFRDNTCQRETHPFLSEFYPKTDPTLSDLYSKTLENTFKNPEYSEIYPKNTDFPNQLKTDFFSPLLKFKQPSNGQASSPVDQYVNYQSNDYQAQIDGNPNKTNNVLARKYVYSYERVEKCIKCSYADPFHKFLDY